MGAGGGRGERANKRMPECAACKKAVAARQDGCLRVHIDAAGNRCPGSGSAPRAAPTGQDGAALPADTSRRTAQTPAHTPGLFPTPHGKTLKRIPRGARDAAADQLARTIDAVLNTPNDRGVWEALFAFATCCLNQPSERGGKSRNLTTAVTKQIQKFKEVGTAALDDLATDPDRRGPTRTQPSVDAAAAKRAGAKLDEGDVKGAIRQLCSTDLMAEPSQTTLRILLPKHPPAPADRRAPAADSRTTPLLVSSAQILGAIKSFPAGSSGGPDKLRPQHLKDMTEKQIGNSLLVSLTNFTNFILAGKVPDWVRPQFFGATLLAFTKKDGGVRPIAVGVTLRRLAAKVACRVATTDCLTHLKPRQLGVGVKGGAEALVHGARQYLDNLPDDHVFVKLDFTNAFNSVRRDAMREAVLRHAPSLLGYVDSAYGGVTTLHFGEHEIDSAEGIQQGDPLGPLLFCLVIHPLLINIQAEFVSGYLDDIGIGGQVEVVAEDVRQLEQEAKALGLVLNHKKCEVIGAPEAIAAWNTTGPAFAMPPLSESTLLGAPIQSGTGVNSALASKTEDLRTMSARLSFLPSHAALYLLRNAFALPKLLYLLRTAPCSDSNELAQYDDVLRAALASLLNVELSTAAWDQASLPLRWGGIGVRSALRLAPSAFLASAAGAAELLSLILPGRVLAVPDAAVVRVGATWKALCGGPEPVGGCRGKQREWDEGCCKRVAEGLRVGADERTTARLLASCAPDSGAWLSAVPIASLGLNLDNNALRIAVGLRLGAPLVIAHQCVCGAPVDKLGQHGLACKRSAGRHLRHNLLNEGIVRALQSAGVQAMREPPGLDRGGGKRPDGATMVPWARGRCLLWDATCPDTLAPSHVQSSATMAGSAAAAAEQKKATKYAPLAIAHEFVPVAIETMGTWGARGAAFISEVGRRIAEATGDPRSAAFLKQRLALAVQRGNAAAVLGTLATSPAD